VLIDSNSPIMFAGTIATRPEPIWAADRPQSHRRPSQRQSRGGRRGGGEPCPCSVSCLMRSARAGKR
jgi:hypothetical protein